MMRAVLTSWGIAWLLLLSAAGCRAPTVGRDAARDLAKEAPRAGAAQWARSLLDERGRVYATDSWSFHQGEDPAAVSSFEFAPFPGDRGAAPLERGAVGPVETPGITSVDGPQSERHASVPTVRATFGAGHAPAAPPTPEARSRGAVVWILGTAGALALVGGFVVAGLWGIRAGTLISLGGAAALTAAFVVSQPWFPAVAAAAAFLLGGGLFLMYGWEKRDSTPAAPMPRPQTQSPITA